MNTTISRSALFNKAKAPNGSGSRVVTSRAAPLQKVFLCSRGLVVRCGEAESTNISATLNRRELVTALPLLGGLLAVSAQPAQAVSRAYTSTGGSMMTIPPGSPGSPYCVETLYYERTGRMLDAMQRIAEGTSEDLEADIAFFESERPKWIAEYTTQHLSKSSGRYVLGFDTTVQAALGLAGTVRWCPNSDQCLNKPFDANNTLYDKKKMLSLIAQAQASNARGLAALSA